MSFSPRRARADRAAGPGPVRGRGPPPRAAAEVSLHRDAALPGGCARGPSAPYSSINAPRTPRVHVSSQEFSKLG